MHISTGIRKSRAQKWVYMHKSERKFKDTVSTGLLSSVADPHHLDAGPDPANHFGTDPDPDPNPTFQFDADPCGSGSGSTTMLLRELEISCNPRACSICYR